MNARDLAGPLVKKLYGALEKYKYVLLIIFLGIILLALPDFGGENQEDQAASAALQSSFDLEEMEEKLEDALSEIDGAGKVTVILSIKTGTRQVLAEDSEVSLKDDESEQTDSTVVLSKGSGYQEVVPVQEIFPQFRGALVICAGGNNPAVKLKLVEAVSALTGLGSDKISICKGK